MLGLVDQRKTLLNALVVRRDAIALREGISRRLPAGRYCPETGALPPVRAMTLLAIRFGVMN